MASRTPRIVVQTYFMSHSYISYDNKIVRNPIHFHFPNPAFVDFRESQSFHSLVHKQRIVFHKIEVKQSQLDAKNYG